MLYIGTNVDETMKLKIHWNATAIATAAPRMVLGNISEISTQQIGPQLNMNDALYTMMLITATTGGSEAETLVTATPVRSKLWAAQTPQGFKTKELISAYEKAGTEMTDDGAVYEFAGNKVKMVEGAYSNKKITTGEDVKMEKVYLSEVQMQKVD